jgi:beta-glucosidase
LQESSRSSTGKHFAVYSVGKGAREGEARTDLISPREIENLLLPTFKAAIKEGGMLGVMVPTTTMTACRSPAAVIG